MLGQYHRNPLYMFVQHRFGSHHFGAAVKDCLEAKDSGQEKNQYYITIRYRSFVGLLPRPTLARKADGRHSACIANAVMIVYVLRMNGDHADVTYNTAWAGFWLLAEISLATVVTCLISLPKFVEVHGKWFKTTFSNLSRPLISLTWLGSSNYRSSGRSTTKDTTVSADLPYDGVVGWQIGSDTRLVHHPTVSAGWNDSPFALRDVNPAVHQGANNQKTI